MKSVGRPEFGILRKAKLLASFSAALAMAASFWLSVLASDEASGSKSLSVLNYVTGWTHDAVGYHPAVFMLLENSSGRDLSNKPIRFQGRFTDLHTAEVTIGRTEIRRELKPHQQFGVALEGAQGYELPFELFQWPSIEAKVMCRFGSGGDESTETLTIAKVESIARTTTEAFESLNQATSYNPAARPVSAPSASRPATSHRHVAKPRAPEPPLMATAEGITEHRSIAQTRQKPHSEQSVATRGDRLSALSLLNSKALPGLGDDFYNFEQRFGLPQSFDAKRPEWTWAKYKHTASGTEIIAGAKERTGKVDIIVMKMPRSSGIDESALVNAARQMSGRLKSQPISAPAKSVRYLPSGRLELVTSASAGYKIICMTPESEDSDNSFILVLSRVQQDADVLLPSLASKTQLLKCLQFLEAKEQPN